MGSKNYNPVTPSRRFITGYSFDEITTDKPYKPLTRPLKKSGGRNNKGRMTIRHRGGGSRRLYRIIDFKRDKIDIQGKVETIEYDPNRTARIALIKYTDGERRYILAPEALKVGDTIISKNEKTEILPGNTMPLTYIPDGTLVHNIEMTPGKGGQLARSAGTLAQLLGKEGKYALIKLPSNEIRKINLKCRATIGQTGNSEHSNIVLGNAGRVRHKGRRPHTRGTAMNPVDHPHGGGEGRSKGGRHPVSPWGLPTKGYKTRKNKKTDKYIVKRRK